jgi:hypothetical protein
MSNENPCEIDAITGEVRTPTPSRYRAKLDTVGDIKREVAKLYRESRSGLMDVNDLSKYSYVLNSLAKIIETSELECRLEYMENKK